MQSTRIDRVIITGASSGLGFDLARRFLELGSRVVINGRDEAKVARAREALLRRIGEPHEITDAALYLARAGFVTGTVLDVDGGCTHGR